MCFSTQARMPESFADPVYSNIMHAYFKACRHLGSKEVILHTLRQKYENISESCFTYIVINDYIDILEEESETLAKDLLKYGESLEDSTGGECADQLLDTLVTLVECT